MFYTSEKRGENPCKIEKLDEDAMLCNTLWSDRRRLITKHFLPFRALLSFEIDLNFHKNVFPLLYTKRNFALWHKNFKISNGKSNHLPYKVKLRYMS